jgi:hypothetical protein
MKYIGPHMLIKLGANPFWYSHSSSVLKDWHVRQHLPVHEDHDRFLHANFDQAE